MTKPKLKMNRKKEERKSGWGSFGFEKRRRRRFGERKLTKREAWASSLSTAWQAPSIKLYKKNKQKKGRRRRKSKWSTVAYEWSQARKWWTTDRRQASANFLNWPDESKSKTIAEDDDDFVDDDEKKEHEKKEMEIILSKQPKTTSNRVQSITWERQILILN